MSYKINKIELENAIKKSKYDFLEFLNKFVYYHKKLHQIVLDTQDSNIYKWIKDLYTINQNSVYLTTAQTLKEVLKTHLHNIIIIKDSQEELIEEFHIGYEDFLRIRIRNYLKSKTNIEDIIDFSAKISKDLANHLERYKNASNRSK
jgi:hypothetical protein